MEQPESSKASDQLSKFIEGLSHQDIISLLNPVRCQLIGEDSVLSATATNGQSETQIKFTVNEFLDKLGSNWKKWIHRYRFSLAEVELGPVTVTPHIKLGGFDDTDDIPPTDYICKFVENLDKTQKRALLACARDGILTDESFINVSSYRGPDRVQVSMKKVVDTLKCWEISKQAEFETRPRVVRWLRWSHVSSANFDGAKKADLDVRRLQCGRSLLPIFYTLLFALGVLGVFVAHIWTNAVNYQDMQRLSAFFSIPYVVLASIAIGVLVFVSGQITIFLFCCEDNLHLICPIKPEWTKFNKFFGAVLHCQARVTIVKVIQVIILINTVGLLIYAHEYKLDIYPALTCLVSDVISSMAFNKITVFLASCRKGLLIDKSTVYAL